MNTGYLLLGVAVMAGTTYLIRSAPLLLFNKKIRNRFLRSFLFYIPYAVLSAMTLPAVLYSTGSIYSAAAGLVAALTLAYFNKSLLTVALCSSAVVFLAELIFSLAGLAL